MSKTIRYSKATKARLIELLERLGYKVTSQSTDGTWTLVRLPDGTPTDYWIFNDHIEHKMNDHRGGAYFYFDDCTFLFEGEDTVSVIAKNTATNSIFLSFHNFEAHRERKK